MIDFFTKQERIIIVFLLFGIVIGAGFRLFYSKDDFRPNSEKELLEIETQIKEKAQTIDSLLSNSNKKSSEKKFNRILIDLNSAGLEELVKLPNVGPVLAKRIIEYRAKNGNFKNIEELIKIKGIGKKKLSSIKPFLKL